jgi:Uma2 family endonuclease
MSAVPKRRKLTVEEYFALEEKAERRSEFYDGEMFPTAGASKEHNILTRNLVGELYQRLKGSPCQVFIADQRVKVDRTGLYTYPDLLVVCGEPEYAPENGDTLTNPRAVVEVLSDSTERYDRPTKFRHYQTLPALQEYVLVAQDEPLVERYTRTPTGRWEREAELGHVLADVLPDHDRRVKRETRCYQFVQQPGECELGHVEQHVHVLGVPWPTPSRVAKPPTSAYRVERAANTSDSRSTASARSSASWDRSAGMACHELADRLACPLFLLGSIRPGELGFGRNPQQAVGERDQTVYATHPLLRRERPEPGHLLGDHLGVARELDGQVHGRLRPGVTPRLPAVYPGRAAHRFTSPPIWSSSCLRAAAGVGPAAS